MSTDQPDDPNAPPAVDPRTEDAPTSDEMLTSIIKDSGAIVVQPGAPPPEEEIAVGEKIKTLLIGKPHELGDQSVFHNLSLVAFLAWVGLGADGLSSSCYGPAEAFANLGSHAYLAVFLAMATIVTVFVISLCYSHIIEEFPSGGGGYLVATKLLGRRAGVLSGCALLVDYVLTITVSIAAAGDALFGLVGTDATIRGVPIHHFKLPAEVGVILFLIVLNLRGVKESVTILLPIFLLFLATHAILIAGAIGLNFGQMDDMTRHVADEVRQTVRDPQIGLMGMLLLLLHAYSLGAGTHTGIEAVSNSMPVMREPRVATAKRTMVYMAVSLAITAGGLMIGYLLLGVTAEAGHDRTLNQVFTEKFIARLGFQDHTIGWGFLWATMLSEGALLVVAAQAGFIDGPRIMSNMALDAWVPTWFANLSERLATHNGIILVGGAGIAALLYTQGDVRTLVIMYSINVFLTFSLSMLGMCRHWVNQRGHNPIWKKRLALFAFGATLCLAILGVTVYEKFGEGGYVTLAVTGLCVLLCFMIRGHYLKVAAKVRMLDEMLARLPPVGAANFAPPDPKQPTAAILVGGYSGLGVHTFLNATRFAHAPFKSVLFLSVGVVDSGVFKGADAMEDLKRHTEAALDRYVDLARGLGMPAASYMSIGTDAVDALEHLCVEVAKKYPKAVFFCGQLIFRRDKWYQRVLHNETAYSVQCRLQWANLPVVILPTRVR